MKNITEIIKKVTSSNINWEYSIFYFIIDRLNESSYNISFWDNEENWASIIEEEKIIGYVWRKYPLIICEMRVMLSLMNLLQEIESVDYIGVSSLIKDLFKIDDHSLYKYFDGDLNFDSFTMEDLWFNTNSI